VLNSLAETCARLCAVRPKSRNISRKGAKCAKFGV
jgi:hypothetical protein